MSIGFSDPFIGLTADQRALAYDVEGAANGWPGGAGVSVALKAALRAADATAADKVAVAEVFGGQEGADAMGRWIADGAAHVRNDIDIDEA